jgi:hypothetical protein
VPEPLLNVGLAVGKLAFAEEVRALEDAFRDDALALAENEDALETDDPTIVAVEIAETDAFDSEDSTEVKVGRAEETFDGGEEKIEPECDWIEETAEADSDAVGVKIVNRLDVALRDVAAPDTAGRRRRDASSVLETAIFLFLLFFFCSPCVLLHLSKQTRKKTKKRWRGG